MQIEKFDIEGPILITPKVFEDERGYFYESYSKAQFSKLGINVDFLQDNQSLSNKGTLRGLHFQAPPFEQGKLVRVSQGSVLDIIVDIRKKSPTYGQSLTVMLSESNKKQLWVPPGFAHGFSVLEDKTVFQYKCTNYYNKDSEGGIVYNDQSLNLDWQVENPIVSEKDINLPSMTHFISPF
jgi:dTDP-4-dehydrorhamnose 3,5-epimerase